MTITKLKFYGHGGGGRRSYPPLSAAHLAARARKPHLPFHGDNDAIFLSFRDANTAMGSARDQRQRSTEMKQVAPLFQNDIQGLRGLAVVLVIAFHIFPALVPGGFIGVDVFFVISGYLITSHLLKELAKTGSIDVTEFYFRRLARLVPGASLLLVAFSFFTIWVLPVTRWRDAGIDIFGSAAYVENWVLMRRSVNYLNAWSAPSIAQHFWSLSVEGQFYLLWPLLLLAAYWLARRARIEFVFWSVFIPLIAALLFIFSVVVFAHNPGLAYFSTSTRIWELMLGGAVAVLVRFDLRPGKFAAEALGAAALASIVGAAFLFDHSTPYPKYAALVPTLGSAALLFVGSNGTSLSNRWLAVPALTYIGDVSYAVYLWHWPLLIFAGYSFEQPLGNWTKLALVGMTFLFAHLSTFYVELPARRMIAALKGRLLLRTAYVAGAMCMCMAFGLGILGYTKYLRYQAANTALDHSIFIGARATEAASIPPAASFRPAPIAARDDRQEECLASYTDTVPRPCQYGAKDNRFRIALVGDSHAMQWLPALLEIEFDLRRFGDRSHQSHVLVRIHDIRVGAGKPDVFGMQRLERERHE